MKGIVLAGGNGSRLLPLTRLTSKQLLPVFNRHMVLYPVSTLVAMGVRDVLIVTKPEHRKSFEDVLSAELPSSVRFRFVNQEVPGGIAEAVTLGVEFLDGDPFLLILGDNIFHGDEFLNYAEEIRTNPDLARVFVKQVAVPNRYGVVELGKGDQVVSLEEKPKIPKSNLALTGLYYLPSDAPEKAAGLKPSARGELEITDLLSEYVVSKRLRVTELGSSIAWFDTGTHEDLLDASNYVKIVEARTGADFGFISYLSQ